MSSSNAEEKFPKSEGRSVKQQTRKPELRSTAVDQFEPGDKVVKGKRERKRKTKKKKT